MCRGHLRLESTLVRPSSDSKVAILSPSPSPAVGHEPVGHTVVHSPAENLHTMAAIVGSSSVLKTRWLLNLKVENTM